MRSRAPATARRFLLASAAVVLGFLLASEVLGRLLPPADVPLTRRKLSLLDRQGCDVVFLGSSRVLRHLDPATFDATMGSRGRSVRSFNLGVPLMLTLEQELVLRELFRRRPRGIRCVVLDPEAADIAGSERLVGTRRSVLWHTLAATWRSTLGVFASDLPAGRKVRALRSHWSAWFRRRSNFGRVQELFVGDLVDRSPPFQLPELAPGGRGYMSLEEALRVATGHYREQLLARRRGFVAALPDWEERVREFSSRLTDDAPVPPVEGRAVLRMQALIRSHGAVPVFFISPGCGPGTRNYLRRMHREGAVEHLVDFARPERFTEFYEPGNLFDENHLDEETAAALTASLAHVLCDRIEEGAMPPL